MQQYMRAKYDKSIEEVEVTHEQLIAVYMEQGKTKDEAEFAVNIGRGLGSVQF
jgi:hypothetical protein